MPRRISLRSACSPTTSCTPSEQIIIAMTPSVKIPENPAPEGYLPNPHSAAVDAAWARFEAELKADDWKAGGEKEGVQLFKKDNPSGGMPLVKGKGTIKGLNVEQVLSAMESPGMRAIWDAPRFKQGAALAVFGPATRLFYVVQAGLGWIVSPRDLVGVMDTKRSEGVVRQVQTSVKDDRAPEGADGNVRGHLELGGWEFKQEGAEVQVTYMVLVDLKGSLPGAVTKNLATDLPLCIARLRETIAEHGFPPHVLPVPSPASTIQLPALHPKATWTLAFRGAEGEFHVGWGKQMYPGGVKVSVEAGSGVDAVVEEGKIVVKVGKEAEGQNRVLRVERA